MIEVEKGQELIEAYTAAYGSGSMMYLLPSGTLSLIDDKTDTCYAVPNWETAEGFMDRLSRSQAAGENLFYGDYKEFIWDPYPDPDAVY